MKIHLIDSGVTIDFDKTWEGVQSHAVMPYGPPSQPEVGDTLIIKEAIDMKRFMVAVITCITRGGEADLPKDVCVVSFDVVCRVSSDGKHYEAKVVEKTG